MFRSRLWSSLVLLTLMTLILSACGGTPTTTTTTPAPVGAGDQAATTPAPVAEATEAPTEAEAATEAPTETEAAAGGATEGATTEATATEEATAEGATTEATAAEEEATPMPTLTPAPGAVVLNYWEMDWGLTEPLQQLVNEFNAANPGIYVQMTQLEWGDYTQKILGAISAGTAPDISGGDSGMPFNLTAQGQALELDEFYNKLRADGRFEDLTQWGQDKWNYNGKYVGVSWMIDPRAIYYRKDLFEQAGIQPPRTHDELLAAAQKLTDPSKEQFGICVPGKQGSYDTDQFYMTLVFQNGGALADEQGNPTFDSPEHLEALRFEQELVRTAAPPGTPSYTFAETSGLYQQNKCAMVFQGGWFVGTLRNEAPDLFENTGILPPLKGRGANAGERIVGFYNPWMIYKQTKYAQEAMQFLDFLMRPENLRRVYAFSGGAHGSVYEGLRADPLYQSNELTAELARQVAENSVDYWWPNNTAAVGIGSMGTGIADIIVNPVLAGARSPEDALRDAQEQLAEVFEQQGE